MPVGHVQIFFHAGIEYATRSTSANRVIATDDESGFTKRTLLLKLLPGPREPFKRDTFYLATEEPGGNFGIVFRSTVGGRIHLMNFPCWPKKTLNNENGFTKCTLVLQPDMPIAGTFIEDVDKGH